MHMAPALLLAVLCKVKLTMCTDVPEHQVDTLKNGTFLKEKKKKTKKTQGGLYYKRGGR